MDRQTFAPPTSATFGLHLASGAFAGAVCTLVAQSVELGWLASLAAYSFGGAAGFLLGGLILAARSAA